MGDEEKFKTDLVALLPRLRRFGRALTGSLDAADDLVQAACERALSRFEQWRPESRLDSWVYTIMRSIWLNEIRSQKVRTGAGVLDPGDLVSVEGSQLTEARVLLSQVQQSVAHLAEGQREALLLVCVEGYTYKEAAAILDVPVGTLMSRLARARLKLAERFGEATVSDGKEQGENS